MMLGTSRNAARRLIPPPCLATLGRNGFRSKNSRHSRKAIPVFVSNNASSFQRHYSIAPPPSLSLWANQNFVHLDGTSHHVFICRPFSSTTASAAVAQPEQLFHPPLEDAVREQEQVEPEGGVSRPASSAFQPQHHLHPAFFATSHRHLSGNMVTLKYSEYGEKSILVRGDTLPVKDKLKQLGAKWNSKDKGWLFPREKWEGEVLDTLKEEHEVNEADEEDEEEVAEPAAKKQKKEAAAAEGNEQGDEPTFIELGSRKRCSLSKYAGKTLIDFREYYEDKNTGEMKPGAKGISLPLDMYKKVAENFPQMEEAIAAQEVTSIDLGGKKKFTYSQYQGKYYVGIREYWEKDGQELPGKKGITLTVESFRKISENHETILGWAEK